MNFARRSALIRSVLLLCAMLAVAGSILAQVAWPSSLQATYAEHKLTLTVPYHVDRAANARLSVQLLSPENEVLGEAEDSVEARPGNQEWKQELAVPVQLPFTELVWQRVRCRLLYAGKSKPELDEIRSVSEILERPLLHILGQKSYLAGEAASLRVVVTDQEGKEIPGTGSVRVELEMPQQATHLLFSGPLDSRGTADPQWRFARGLSGNYGLHVFVKSPLGEVETREEIRVEGKSLILLTTEKPIYQPGQTIHVRALALAQGDRHAVEQPIALELEDPRGNKVFRKATQTDLYGIASAEFQLADEVNLGAYHLRAVLGKGDSARKSAELTLLVQRYVLPKFRVAVDLAQKDGKPKRDYRPGDVVSGTVRANYFFGKPVDHAEIEIKASGVDVEEFEAAHASGKTGAEGSFHFELKLPGYFAGDKLDKGEAPVLVEATVKDATGHAETRAEPITVSRSALLITALPEGGKLIPFLENQVYVLTSYPDGTPAATRLSVQANGGHPQKLATDHSGIAILRLTPTESAETLHIEADDQRGGVATSDVELQARDGVDQVLLRSDHSVYKPGDQIDLHVISTRQQGAAYIDVVKDGQTILTRDVDLEQGHAELSLNATPELSGTLQVSVYEFGSDSQAIADHRLIFVQPATELRVDATTSSGVYKPGEEAQVRLRVTDSHGKGVSAAVGIDVVDEAVFALAEKQPGFAKVFFYLQQELLKPRYEIHSLAIDRAVNIGSDRGESDESARVLFSAAESTDSTPWNEVSGRELPQGQMDQYRSRYQQALEDAVGLLARELSKDTRSADVRTRFAALRDAEGESPRDAWGTPLRLEATGWNTRPQQYYRLVSAGPDRRFDTGDDLSVAIEVHSGTLYNPGGSSSSLRIEHERGPMNGLAAVLGTATDASGAVIPHAKVQLTLVAEGATRQATTDAHGGFAFAALPAGHYELCVEAAGFVTSVRSFTAQPRDMVEIKTVLGAGAVTETIDAAAMGGMEIQFENRVMLGRMPATPLAGQSAAGVGIYKKDARSELRATIDGLAEDKEQGTGATHVRSYFPEALYVNPEVITDGNGMADVSIPLADSITTWRMGMFASTREGALGSGTSSLKVFQDFFVDLDLPVTLTQGDRVSIPVAIYNYSGKSGDVTLSLKQSDWFSLTGEDEQKTLTVEPSRVGTSQFTIEATRIGKFKLTVTATMSGGERKDIVEREIEVVPNGEGKDIVFNGRLEGTVQHSVEFPQSAIPDASKIFVRLYPGPMSQIVEGMDGILRMPGGCFEQTSSSTYPNVLALDYLKRTRKVTPETRAKAEGYIATGYQRLLTFEVPGGGFSWFGQAPANKILTAYGLMEFHDMAQVYDVDPRLIERTGKWLADQQQPDGSWRPDTEFINEGATNRFNTDRLRITAYIAWSLEATGYKGEAVARATHYVESHLGDSVDSYTLAVLANFAVEGKDGDLTQRVMQQLLASRKEGHDTTWWSSESTGIYGSGQSAEVETTGLAVQALLKGGQSPDVVRKALGWIISQKRADGNWGTTQATIMALRALVMASEKGSADARGSVQVLLNGKMVQTVSITADNSDLLQQVALPGIDPGSANAVELRFEGTGEPAYQIAGRYFVPWEKEAVAEPLSIEVTYDRTTLAENDFVNAKATVRSHLDATANMVMVDLGIPPGFDLLSEDLQALEEQTAQSRSGRLEKFSVTATQAILYFDSIAAGKTVTVHFRLRAKYPIRSKGFESKVYEYYNPAIKANVMPVQFQVRAR